MEPKNREKAPARTEARKERLAMQQPVINHHQDNINLAGVKNQEELTILRGGHQNHRKGTTTNGK